MRSSVARLLAVLLLFAPMGASPLGLGEIDLRSALNEPLDAEIELGSLGRTQLDEIQVRLASREAFEQAGVERPLFLTRFKFALAQRPDGTPYIKITSREPVKEPFLDFLVEADWPSGHLLREYTVLLDPPVFLDEEPAPVEAPTAGTAGAVAAGAGGRQAPGGAGAARQPEPAPGRVSHGAVVDNSPEGGLSYGPVQRTDTLWSIARDLRPDDSISIEQTMMALLKSNPEAFYNNNINQLKAGYVLRVSDPALLTEMSRAEAAVAARQQYEAWLDAKRRRAREAGSRPEGTDGGSVAGTTGAAAGESGPRLRLVVPDAAEGKALAGTASSTEAGAPETAEIDKLREDLAMALEQSEVARQENQDLRERLAVLEEQIDSMQRLVTLKDDTLAAIQADSGDETGQGLAAGGAGSPAASAGDGAEGQAGVQAPGDQTESAQGGEAETAAPPKTATRQPAPAAVPPPSPERGGPQEFLNQILADPMLLGIAGLAVLLLATLGWLMVRRRRAAEEPFVETTAGVAAEEEITAAAAGDAETVEAEEAEVFGDTLEEVSETSDDAGLDIMQADEEEIDILAEADVYLAYRRFDKAEELLKDAIQSEPDRQELVLKLLEVYAAGENKDAFVLQAENLKTSLTPEDDSVWDKVVAMGRQLAPEHPLFSGADGSGEGVELSADDSALDASLEADLDGLDLDVDLDAALDQFEDSGADDLLTGGADTGGDIFADEQSPEDASSDEERRGQAADPLAGDEGLTLEEPQEAGGLSAEPADEDLTLDDQTLAELGELGGELELTDAGEATAEEGSREEDEEERRPSLEDGQGEDEALSLAPEPGDDDQPAGQDLAAAELSLEEDAVGLDIEPETESAEPAKSAVGDGDANMQPAALGEGLDFEQTAGSDISAEIGEQRLTGTDDAHADENDLTAADAPDGDDWLADLGGDIPDLEDGDQNIDEEFSNLISGDDEVGTKLDLAKAYIDMGDQDSARNILSEIASEGSEDQQREANELMQQMG